MATTNCQSLFLAEITTEKPRESHSVLTEVLGIRCDCGQLHSGYTDGIQLFWRCPVTQEDKQDLDV
jgi:hypothetical protein